MAHISVKNIAEVSIYKMAKLVVEQLLVEAYPCLSKTNDYVLYLVYNIDIHHEDARDCDISIILNYYKNL